MNAERWKQAEKLFQSAMERAPEERATFLAKACEGDETLHQEVKSLLEYQPAAGGALEAAVEDATLLMAERQPLGVVGRRLGPYQILRKIGAGGMGEVYLAEDARLGRKVALKLLPALYTEDRGRVRRFAQEARAASALNHPNIITIFEIGQASVEEGGAHFIATEFVDGQTLRQWQGDKNAPLTDTLDILIQTVSALAAAHEAGIVHRDIKPENIMLRRDGYIKVLDFGLAKLSEHPPSATSADVSQLPTAGLVSTEPGRVMGTVAYMSPEQARGLEMDARTDIFSLGVMGYELLTGERPFAGSTGADLISAILSAEPPPLRAHLPDIPESLEQIIRNSLRKDRNERYQTSKELLANLKALKQRLEIQAELARSGEPEQVNEEQTRQVITSENATDTGRIAPAHTTSSAEVLLSEIKRHRMGVALAAAALVIIACAWFYWRRANLIRARAAVPRIEELAQANRFFEAFDLAVQVREQLPNDPTIARLMGSIADDLSVATDPPGAQVYLKRFAPDATGNFPSRQLAGATPLNHQQIARGSYILSIEKEGFARIERSIEGRVIERVSNSVYLSPPIQLKERLIEATQIPDRMVLVPGGDYRLVSWLRPTEERVRLSDYFIDKYEVTNREYQEFINAGGYLKPQFWQQPFVKARRTMTWDEAMRELTDRTGLPGPRNWSRQNFPEGKADHPVTDITWYEAAAYAAFRGKQLPTIFQWEKAARNGAATFAGLTMPWGMLEGPVTYRANFKGSGTVPVESLEFGMSPFGCFNMAGNVAEWGLNQKLDGFVASGGSWDDLYYLFGYHGNYPGFHSSNKLGFRCVLAAPGTTGDQGAMRLGEPATINYTPVSNADYNKLLGHYHYEKSPLDARTIETIETAEWRREKITYSGADGDRATAYLYLPKNFAEPFQLIHIMPPSGVDVGAYTLTDVIEDVLAPFIKSGRAVFGVVLKGYSERRWPEGRVAPRPESVEYLEQTVNWVTDLRRGLDYLETRKEVDANRLAYFSPSSGGFKLIPPAVETRYRSVILMGASIKRDQLGRNAGANPVNFVGRIRAPKLMLHGRYDEAAPFNSFAEPLFHLLCEPKRLTVYEGGHIPEPEVLVPAVNGWLDETLGPVKRRN